MTEALQWGAVDLLPTDAVSTALGYMVEASADGTNWGNPAAVIVAIQSRLQDGSIAVVDSYQNREAPIHVRVTSTTYAGLAAAEAALVAETQRDGYNTLSWTPNVALAFPSVFDVVYGVLSFDFDDLGEVNLERNYVATLTCLPFPRSATEAVSSAVAPPAGTPVVTSVDACSSATGWVGSPSAAAVVSGAVTTTQTVTLVDSGDSTSGWADTAGFIININSGSVADAANVAAGSYLGLQRTGSITTSVTKYIAIDVVATQNVTVEVFLDGTVAPVIAFGGAPRAGYTRLWVQAPGSSVNVILLRFVSPGGFVFLFVDQIIRTDVSPLDSYLRLTRTGSITTSATPYLMIDVNIPISGPGYGIPAVQVLLDGALTPIVATAAVTGNGYTRLWVRAPGSSVNTVQVRHPGGQQAFSTLSLTLSIDQIQKTDAGPAVGTRRQLFRTLAVAGTMRTQGRLSIQHETSSLGEVLAYCYQDAEVDYVPPLRQFFVSGGTVTVDTTLVSGGSNMIDTLVEYQVPSSKLVPGNHHMYARLKGDSAGPVTINVAAYTRVGSTDVTGSISMSVTLTLATTYAIFDLGALSLPTTLLPDGTAGTVRITIQDADTSGIDITLDEAWLFNLDIGSLNHVDCGSASPAVGGSSKRLWLDPAILANDGMDAIFRGHAADRTDAFHPATDIKAWTPPQFDPPSMKVFTVCTNALDAAVELRAFPRYLHNVAA